MFQGSAPLLNYYCILLLFFPISSYLCGNKSLFCHSWEVERWVSGRAHCSVGGPEFGSQHPYQVAHKHWQSQPEIWYPLLASMGEGGEQRDWLSKGQDSLLLTCPFDLGCHQKGDLSVSSKAIRTEQFSSETLYSGDSEARL